MDALWAIPILLAFLLAWLINYLADVLPGDLRLGLPVCQNPACRKAFTWKDYLLLRPCPECGKKRSVRSFIIILLTLAASLYCWFRPPLHLGYFLGFLMLAYLVLVAVIDLEHRLILRPLSITGLALAAVAGFIMHGWQSTLIGGGAGFIILYLFYLFGRLFTRWRARRLGQDPRDAEEALGSGDVTLATILGLFLGWPLIWFGILLGLLFAGFISLVVILVLMLARKYRQQAFMVFIPLGPAFILSTTLLVYLPNWISRMLPT